MSTNDTEPSEESTPVGKSDGRRPETWGERGTFFPRLAVGRPVTVVMLFIATVVLGAIAYMEIPLQLLPSGYTPPFLYVQIPTRPAPPKDNEESIALPVEEAFGTVRNVHRMRTWISSSRVGVLLEFKEGTDMDEAYNQIRDRLDRTMPDLPTEIGQYFIWKYNPNNDPVYWVGAALPDNIDRQDVAHVLESRLTRKLERVPGVSRVSIEGAPSRQIQVQVDDRRANAAGIGVAELVQRLQADNFAMSGGTVEDGGRRYPLRMVARYDDLAEVRAIPIAANGTSLGDVADVSFITPGDRSIYRVNGRPGVIVQVFKESGANTVEVCDGVREVLDSDDPSLADFHFVDFFNRGFYIEDSLDNLTETAIWGGFFAVIILFGFLRRIRITLIITFAIPVSLLVTVVVMYFTGSTLNSLTLMGLMLSVGMVVDNSIVVVENIQRARLSGMDAVKAAIYGTGEVALAIVVATSTSIVVFLPLILMSGSRTLSFYLGKIGYPVCIALVASLVVSLVFIPLAASTKHGGAGKAPPRLRLLERMEGVYSTALSFCLRRRADMVLLALALFATTFYPLGELEETDTQAGNPNDFHIRVNFDPNVTFEERDAYLQEAEKVLLARSDELGIENILTRLGGNWGRARLRIFLRQPKDRPMDKQEIIAEATKAMPQRAGIAITTRWDQSGNDEAIEVEVRGPDSGVLAEIAEDVSRRLRRIDGVVSVATELEEEAAEELQLTVDRELAQRRGVSPLMVGLSVDYAIRGRRLNDFHAPDREVPMVVIAPEDKRRSVDDVEQFTIRSPTGDVRIGDITTSSVKASYEGISREDRKTKVDVSITADSDDLAKLGAEIDAVMKGFEFPRGYSWNKGYRFRQLQQNEAERNFALALAILSVFLLMGVLFESFVLPFSIVVSIPFAFTGVYWMLFLTDTPFDVMAGVGLIILIGVVVNNAVVLVDLIGQLRRAGHSRPDAIVEAGRKRLRPILMTALTTIFGLLPMAAGSAALIGIPYAPLGRALIGGLLASTILTLFIVPLSYTLFDDLSDVGQRLLAALLRRGSPPTPDPSVVAGDAE